MGLKKFFIPQPSVFKKINVFCETIKVRQIIHQNQARLGDGLDERPTVMVGEKRKREKNSVKIGAY